MPDKAWKARERQAAAYLGAKRNVLSGSAGRDDRGRSDSTHDRVFMETKHYARHAAWTLWRNTKELAKREGKYPVLMLAEKGKAGFLVVVHTDDLDAIIAERARVMAAESHD